jgi:hypothetical protein
MAPAGLSVLAGAAPRGPRFPVDWLGGSSHISGMAKSRRHKTTQEKEARATADQAKELRGPAAEQAKGRLEHPDDFVLVRRRITALDYDGVPFSHDYEYWIPAEALPRPEERPIVDGLARECCISANDRGFFPIRNLIEQVVAVTKFLRPEDGTIDDYIAKYLSAFKHSCNTHNVSEETYKRIESVIRQYIVTEAKKLGLNVDDPPVVAVDASASRQMGYDLNTAVKKAKAENLARVKPRPSAHQLATYKALVKNVDLLNPELSEAERLRRANRLVRAYQRVHKRKPNFPASPEVLTAFSIVNKDNYQRRKAKAGQAKLAM